VDAVLDPSITSCQSGVRVSRRVLDGPEFRTVPQFRPKARNPLHFPTSLVAGRVSSEEIEVVPKVWIQTTMAEITDQVPGQEHFDEIQQDQEGEEVPPIPGQEVAPPEPEFISETLYIQNLNDKVKLPCELFAEASNKQLIIIWNRHEGDSEQPFSSLWKSYRCGRSPQSKNAGSSLCFVT